MISNPSGRRVSGTIDLDEGTAPAEAFWIVYRALWHNLGYPPRLLRYHIPFGVITGRRQLCFN